MERNRTRALAVTSFIVVLLLTAVVTATAISLSGRNKNIIDDTPVAAKPVFSVPVASYTSILMDYSGTDLQYNATMKRWESHKAVDLAAPLGSNVVATYAGTVASITDDPSYGRTVVIQHANGLTTTYSGLGESVNVSVGDRVDKGQLIGTVGQTSNIQFTDTPHIRVEVTNNGVKVNPDDYIDFPNK